ncbi:hypothetical protein CGMCC3_g16658 [Colletotrichum fructicola]|nr:uncharacterized protein CGMCC3_g16658 [Colletotrichum fructicola]KAE9567221.1 hypothetical protein CGMCC3_g16658 [Colletotrichum fructicola]
MSNLAHGAAPSLAPLLIVPYTVYPEQTTKAGRSWAPS